MRSLCFAVLGVLASATGVRAQCASNASSCVSCHEVEGRKPVLDGAEPWHVEHAFGDLCASCHGGDPAAATQAEAHRALIEPLAEPSITCGRCHEDDALTRAERYANVPRAPAPSSPPPPPTAALQRSTADRVLLALSVVLGLWLARALRSGRRGRGPRAFLAALRAPAWSPYAAGALLGSVVAISEVFYERPIAVSGAVDRLAAYVARALFPSLQYYAHVLQPQVTPQVFGLIGIVLGAYASAALSGQAAIRYLPDTLWAERFGPSRAKRAAIAFAGAALVQLGADIAGGCTSGLAISAGAALAPAAFVFMAGMFAGGIPTAMLIHRKPRRSP